MKYKGYQATDKLNTDNPPNNEQSKMIKVNSKVIIKGFKPVAINGFAVDVPPVMIVEGLYYMDTRGLPKYEPTKHDKPTHAKCLWYNTRKELQKEIINLEILTEL